MNGPRIIRANELRRRVRFEDLIEPMAQAFRLVSDGAAQNGFITLFPEGSADAGDVYVKASAIPGRDIYIVKVAPWFAANARHDKPQGGFVAAFDARTGYTLALLEDEHYLSDIRTAAAGALAARLFAPKKVHIAAVLGAGAQARLQILALFAERPFSRLLVWARNRDKSDELAAYVHETLPQLAVEIADSVETAVRGCDVLITATLSREPLVCGEWLHPGQHITAVGADDQTKCELDAHALLRARVFVDEHATTLANGDIFRAVAHGANPGRIVTGEIGSVLAGKVAGRVSEDDITIAKLVGVGAQDLLAAEHVLRHLEVPS